MELIVNLRARERTWDKVIKVVFGRGGESEDTSPNHWYQTTLITSKNMGCDSGMAQVFSSPSGSIYSPPRSWKDLRCISFILVNTCPPPSHKTPARSPTVLPVEAKYMFFWWSPSWLITSTRICACSASSCK